MIVTLVLAGLVNFVTGQTQQCSSIVSGLCPVAYGGYHYLCGQYTAGQAAAACLERGLRLAELTDALAVQALYMMQACAVGELSAWIGGWNGMGADPCAYLDITGGVIMTPGYAGCNADNLRAVVCQDIPLGTTTIDRQTYAYVLTPTTTTSTLCTACGPQRRFPTRVDKAIEVEKAEGDAKPKGARGEEADEGRRRGRALDSSSSSSKTCDRSDPLSCTHDTPPRCPVGPCTPICPLTICGLHVVQGGLMSYDEAAEECSRYGWHLADITSGQHADVAFLQRYCGRPGAGFAVWIRSYNGVDGAQCIKALAPNADDNVPIGYGIDPQFCDAELLPYALCQNAPPAPTGSGVFEGLLNYQQVTLSGNVTRSFAATTATVTSTNYFPLGCF
jgi:hypothetical protein